MLCYSAVMFPESGVGKGAPGGECKCAESRGLERQPVM